MNKEEVETLYRELIIPESKHPYRFEKQERASVEAYNPICGDKYRIFIGEDFHFYGHGCALSKASGSLLMREIEGLSASEAGELIRTFIDAVKSGEVGTEMERALEILIELKNHEGREDCILLTWNAMAEYLEKKE